MTGSPAVPDLTGAEKSSLVDHGRAACARMAEGDTSIEVLTALNEEMEGTSLQSALLTVYASTAELCPEQELAF